MGIPFQCNKATRKLVKALKECPCGHQSFVVRLVLVALLRGVVGGLRQQPVKGWDSRTGDF